ncbi:MAG: glycosyltransferase [Acidobacteria bacterium]|nr:glycosyltransferase [Acidobacteriota bacterium]
MKKNVLELTGTFMQGGSERQAVQLARLLHDEGSFRVFVGCLDCTGELRLEVERLGIKEIPEFKLTSFYDANFLRQAKRCAEFIRANQISVVHTHDFYTNIFGMVSAFLARVPARVASKRETLSKSKNQFFAERQAFRLADKITANAEAVKQFLVETGVAREKIVTVYNGLDLQRLQPAQNAKREEILRELGLPAGENKRFVTIVANLRSDVKNHRMFLQAAQKVNEKIESVAFVLAGEGELTESLKRFAHDLNIGKDVFFLGGAANVGELLSISDVCVLSSKSEGFSNSILEYMSAAKPVVATRVGGACEAVIDGETGFLVESGDDQMMAKRLVELLENPEKAKRFGARGRQIVGEKFTLAAQLNKTLELYDRLLIKKAKNRIYK